jgi:hypothetical protein
MINAINYFIKKPQILFLIDAVGALLTSILLVVIKNYFNQYIGMPPNILILLAVIAAGFSLYSTICFFCLKKSFTIFLILIACANLLYCGFTLMLLATFKASITYMGIAYFVVETVVICTLAFMEYKLAITNQGR